MAAATHADRAVARLCAARRRAATEADYGATSYKRRKGWADLEAVEAKLREADPDGDWRYEHFNYDTGEWEVKRR